VSKKCICVKFPITPCKNVFITIYIYYYIYLRLLCVFVYENICIQFKAYNNMFIYIVFANKDRYTLPIKYISWFVVKIILSHLDNNIMYIHLYIIITYWNTNDYRTIQFSPFYSILSLLYRGYILCSAFPFESRQADCPKLRVKKAICYKKKYNINTTKSELDVIV
jgi:hypothetical protein